jgi:NADPH2:quinone reductase
MALSATPTSTRAIVATSSGPVDAPTSFVELELELEPMRAHDLLVEVRAVSVNPVDVKVRASFDADAAPKVLGFDAAGVVVATGPEVTTYSEGDEVYYAGVINRPGSNATYQLVDERLVGRKPATLDFAEAAALPLTTLTAWETLFERFRLTRESEGTLLVMAGAGGVGSMVTQLARKLTNVTVIATASRPESTAWCTEMGAHRVVNHHHLLEEVKAVAPDGVNWIFSPFSAGNVEAYAELMAAYGEVVAIDEPEGLDILALKSKSQTWHWEFMFTRALFDPTSTLQREHLNAVAELIDKGTLRSTMTQRLAPIGVEALREAHRQVESSSSVGKVVVAAE